jgi:hypothetical protein
MKYSNEQLLEFTNEFIDFCLPIPEDKWCIGKLHNDRGQHCFLGHLENCGKDDVRPFICPVLRVISDSSMIYLINNGDDERYQQPTPKQRVLAAFNDVKNVLLSEKRSKLLSEPPIDELISNAIEKQEKTLSL